MAEKNPSAGDDELREVPLPLEVGVERREDGWTVRAPLRTEVIRVEKVVAPYQEARIRARLSQHLERLTDVVRREELDVRTEGDLEAETTGGVPQGAPPV